ncbi:MAG: hypothetical protein ACI4B4_05160 [Segatella copri]
MTLFEAVSPDDIFQEALDAFYATATARSSPLLHIVASRQ